MFNAVKKSYSRYSIRIRCTGSLMFFDKPKIMGIINITPDSFYSESRAKTIDDVLKMAEKHISEGADILDVGAVSTRPGSLPISTDVEKERIIPALKELRKRYSNCPISVDTYNSTIAEIAIQEGADIINDISGGTLDKNMFEIIARYKIPYVLTHIKGTPTNMQENPVYNDVVKEVIFDLSEKYNALKKLGIFDIIIDPGFGFGKTVEHNYELLANLNKFHFFEKPVLIGLSRKSMIWRVLNISPEKALNGTTALNMFGLLNGANVLRVHDVKEAKETIELYLKISNFISI